MSRLSSWGPVGKFLSAFTTGIGATAAPYRKEAFRSYPGVGNTHRLSDYGRWEYRDLRYQLFWALYENTAYDPMHRFSEPWKTDKGLYRSTRGAYSIAYRLGEFWATYLLGGRLDYKAGDGTERPSALPIITDSLAVRKAIGAVWRASRWQINKTIYARTGAILGDVGLKAVPDERRQTVSIEVVHPNSIKWVSVDSCMEVQAYVIEYRRRNPAYDPKLNYSSGLVALEYEYATYTERCWMEGSTVKYATLKDGVPYNWRGFDQSGRPLPYEWDAAYDFVPFVITNHIKIDQYECFGMSEYYSALTKNNETNDLASKLHDQIRKIVEGAWFFAGVSAPKDGSSPLAKHIKATKDSPEPWRETTPVLYGPMGATARELVIPLDIQFTSMEIMNQSGDMERDYPEMRYDRIRVAGDASAKALREAKKPAEAKVEERRSAYDDSQCAALVMAIRIGALLGYPNFEGLTYDSKPDGDMEFSIDKRTVFGVDQFDELERKGLFWTNANLAKQSGYPLVLYLKDEGYTPKEIKEYEAEVEKENKKALEMATAVQAAKTPPDVKAPELQSGGGMQGGTQGDTSGAV